MLRGQAEPGPAIRIGDRLLPGRAPNPLTAPRPGQPAVAALRAERVRIGTTGALTENGTRLAARVADVVFEGERVLYELVVPELGRRSCGRSISTRVVTPAIGREPRSP